jgi:hypothetical protein
MDVDDWGVLYGLALGDGHISSRERWKKDKHGFPRYRYEAVELVIGHGPKQHEYIQHKANLIARVLGGSPPRVSEVTSNNKLVGKTYPGFRLAKTSPVFREMHGIIYTKQSGVWVKRFTPQLLDRLTAHSLGLWFMDDGSMRGNKNKNGEVTSLFAEITTQIAQREEAELVADWFARRWGIATELRTNKAKFDIGFGTQACVDLDAVIAPFVIPCMSYKLKWRRELVLRHSIRHPHHHVILPSSGDDVAPVEKPKAVRPIQLSLGLD